MSIPDIRNVNSFLKKLWEGWRVLDDPRYAGILLFSPDRADYMDCYRITVQEAIREGYVKQGSRDGEKGMWLTDKGLEHLGLPTEAQQKSVEVSA